MAAGLGKFRMTISQESIYYETYGHVTDDVTCRKWRLFKERNPRSAHTSSPTGLLGLVRRSATGQTAAYHVVTWRRHIFLFQFSRVPTTLDYKAARQETQVKACGSPQDR